MAEERIITFNLREELLKVPRWERHKKAVTILKKKLKADKIKVDNRLNEKISRNSGKIRVKITKLDDKSIRVGLVE